MRISKLSVALAGAALGAMALGALPALGADHRDAPLTKAAPQSDINDVYVWAQPNGNVVYAMTVNPLTSPADTSKLQLDPATVYEFKLDLNGDAIPDASIKFTFSGTGPVQDVTVRQALGSDAVVNDPVGNVVAQGKTSAGAGVTTFTSATGTKYYVGPRDDPFFFDLAAFNAGLKFTKPGVDTFKGTNVTAIVWEVPAAVFKASVPSGKLGVWGTTSKQNNLGKWIQLDRMGRPAIATVFIPAADKDAFNNDTPDRDKAIWKADVLASLKALGSKPELADVLLPDILTFDISKPNGYLNGRALADDVIDISLQVITGDPKASDGVDANDLPFLTTFPYLAAPHGAAPGAPNTGSATISNGGNDLLRWTLPLGLVAAAGFLAAAGFVARRKPGVQA